MFVVRIGVERIALAIRREERVFGKGHLGQTKQSNHGLLPTIDEGDEYRADVSFQKRCFCRRHHDAKATIIDTQAHEANPHNIDPR